MRRFKTIKFRILGLLIIVIVPVVISLFLSSVLTYITIKNQVYTANFDTLSLHRNQIDSELSNIKTQMVELDHEEYYTDRLQSDDTISNYYAANYYSRILSTYASRLKNVEALLVFSGTNEQRVYSYNMKYSNNFASFTKKYNIIDYIIENADRIAMNNQWMCYAIDGESYLIFANKKNQTYFCSWTSTKNLLEDTKDWNVSRQGSIHIIANRGTVEASTGVIEHKPVLPNKSDSYYVDGKYLIISIASNEGDFMLVESINVWRMISTYRLLFYISLSIIIVFVFAVFLVLRTLNNNIFIPIAKMRTAIGEINRGNTNYQIPEVKCNIEFLELIRAFNSMIEQIKNLKIKTYEDEIEQNKIVLQYMQLQIEPHFYLNTLNTICAMAQVGDIKMIIELSKNMSDYMRFIVQSRYKNVTVAEELDHIRKYINIIRIRNGNIEYRECIDDDLMSFLIPPLIIQSLIENVIKHTFNFYEPTQIIVIVQKEKSNNVDGVSISVIDNGKGFPDEFIHQFRNNEMYTKGIGLNNIRMRLKYYYHGCASVQVDNLEEGGGAVRIWIGNETSTQKEGNRV